MIVLSLADSTFMGISMRMDIPILATFAILTAEMPSFRLLPKAISVFFKFLILFLQSAFYGRQSVTWRLFYQKVSISYD
jgi:hypothetical protein